MTAGTTHDPLRVDLLGADQRLRDTLALVFRGPAQGVCLLVPRADAQAVVVNLDGAGAAAEWERYREAHPDRPAIVLSIGAAQIPGAAAVVQKPVRIDRLVEAVRVVRSVLGDRPGTPTGRPIEPPAPRVAARAEASLPPTIDRLPVHAPPVTHPPVEVAPTNVRESNENARTVATKAIAEITRTLATQVPPPRAPESPRTEAFAAPRTAASPAESLAMRSRARTAAQENPQWDALCGSAPDIHADDPSQVDGVRYKGDARFLRCVEQAVEDARLGRQIIGVRTQQRLLLVVSGTPSTIASCVSDDLLATLARQAHGTHDFDTIVLSALPPASDTIQVLSTEALLWKLGLWTYRGQIPYATSLRDRMYLRHWPNFTRLLRTPDALRIAALLTRHPMQLTRVAEALKIPQRHVFAFFAAASTIGLMGVARREIDYLLEQEAPTPHEHRDLLERVAQRLASGEPGGDTP
jgi:hypothetical protein